MKKITAMLMLVVFIIGCASTAQKGAIGLAYKNYKEGDYEDVLKWTSQAEKYKDTSHEMKAEILFLKALALEELKRHNESQGTFKYVADNFGDTEYGYRAKEKLK